MSIKLSILEVMSILENRDNEEDDYVVNEYWVPEKVKNNDSET